MIFIVIDGYAPFSRYLPVTNLKLKMAITGAAIKDNTMAKSITAFRLFPN